MTLSNVKSLCFNDSKHIFKFKIGQVFPEKNASKPTRNLDFILYTVQYFSTGPFLLNFTLYFRLQNFIFKNSTLSLLKSICLCDSNHVYNFKIVQVFREKSLNITRKSFQTIKLVGNPAFPP
jgi:hypothetical protein